jgi:hypothetical protein
LEHAGQEAKDIVRFALLDGIVNQRLELEELLGVGGRLFDESLEFEVVLLL